MKRKTIQKPSQVWHFSVCIFFQFSSFEKLLFTSVQHLEEVDSRYFKAEIWKVILILPTGFASEST